MLREIDDEPIFVLGGGGHASDVLNVIERLGLLSRVAGCLDDEVDPRRMRSWNVKYLGARTAGRLDSGRFVLGVGTPQLRSLVLGAVDLGAPYRPPRRWFNRTGRPCVPNTTAAVARTTGDKTTSPIAAHATSIERRSPLSSQRRPRSTGAP